LGLPDDRGDWNDWHRQFLFRRKVEGAARSIQALTLAVRRKVICESVSAICE
jgi:hypothetical protein